MILSRYIARRFLLSFLGVLAVMLGILLLVDMVEQLRRFQNAPLSLAQAAHLAALRVPASVYSVLPLIVMLATLALFIALARSSELVAARAAGRSALVVVAAPALVALAIGGVSVAVFNPLVAVTSKQYDVVSDRIRGGTGSVLSVSREGLWLREAGPEGQRVISAQRASAEGTRLYDVVFLDFDAGFHPVARIEAAEAQLMPDLWQLRAAKIWNLSDPNPEQGAVRHEALALPTSLSEDRIRDSFGTPSAIPVWDLPAFIAALDRAGLSALQHRVWLQMELALPLFLMAMVLVGAAFTLRHIRAGGQGVLVLVALIAGFGVFFLRNFAQVLGEAGQIPVALSAWSPPVAAVLLALGLLVHLEEG